MADKIQNGQAEYGTAHGMEARMRDAGDGVFEKKGRAKPEDLSDPLNIPSASEEKVAESAGKSISGAPANKAKKRPTKKATPKKKAK